MAKTKTPKKSHSKQRGVVVGIDFGTTYTKVACLNEAGAADVVRFKGREMLIPTAVYFHEDGRMEFGERANNYALKAPDRYFCEFKRLLGQTNTDGSPVSLGKHPKTGKNITAVYLVEEYLRYVIQCAAEELQAEILGAVVSVPAYYQDAQLRHTKEGAQNAGINVLQLVHEPVAAAISYLPDREEDGIYMVFDLGGGTFDVSIVEIQNQQVKVKATDGDSKLGGCDFDMLVLEVLLIAVEKQQGFTPDEVNDAQDLQELKVKVTKARHDLSESESTSIVSRIGSTNLNVDIQRREFNEIVKSKADEAISITKRCLSKANLEPEEILKILLVGGSTHMAIIQESLDAEYGNKVLALRDREYCVAKGAAIQSVASAKKSSDLQLIDSVKHLPAPDIQCTVKTSHALSISIVDKNDPTNSRLVHCEMIPSQSDLPCKKTEYFSPIMDNQDRVDIQITQGKHGTPVDPSSIVQTLILDIQPLPKEQRKRSIEITYRFDEDGIMHVHAKDLIGGNEQDAQVGLQSAVQNQAV